MKTTNISAHGLRKLITIGSFALAGVLYAQKDFYVNFGNSKTGLHPTGTATASGYAGEVIGLGFSHQLASQLVVSGMKTVPPPTHKVITLAKAIDKATPALLQAFTRNDVFPTVTFKFMAVGVNGALVNYYTITLTNARIVDMQCWLGSQKGEANLFPTTSNADMEKISLAYDKVEWTIKDGNVTNMDDWR